MGWWLMFYCFTFLFAVRLFDAVRCPPLHSLVFARCLLFVLAFPLTEPAASAGVPHVLRDALGVQRLDVPRWVRHPHRSYP